MGFLVNRISVVSSHLIDRMRHGLPTEYGPMDREILIVLDGVGGFQFSPLMIRRVLGYEKPEIGTVWYRWQWGLVGEIWTDLMWVRRNRVMGAKLAREIRAIHRRHPDAKLHLAAFSGGAGIAVFALESLKGRPLIDTLILGCPAISPEYDLSKALSTVRRAYSLVSALDRFLLGIGTRIFGTTDRQFCAAAGQTGFRMPPNETPATMTNYEKLLEIHWHSSLQIDGHYGGHTGWLNERFLKKHLLPMLRGQPLIATTPIGAHATVSKSA